MPRITLAIVLFFLISPPDFVQAKPYDYPILDPFAATVIGTPNAYKAELPRNIPVEDLELTVFEEREVPDVLWHSDELRYSLVPQDHPAPLIFVIAGTGAGYHSPKMKMLQRAFYQAGFHVLSLSSPTHPNFMVAASTTGVPGHFREDSQDLYRVMMLAWLAVKEDIEITKFFLTGYSLGAAQAAFVSQLDEARDTFQFEKVLLINPPVSLYTSALILDEMLVNNLSTDPESVHQYFDETFRAFSEVYQTGNFVNLSGEFLYAAYQQRNPKREKIATLIGIDFRMSSASMVFTSDILTNAGYIKPKNLTLSSTDSLTDYYKVSVRVSFLEYFEDLFSPYYQTRYPGISEPELLHSLSLRAIESYLRQSPKIGMVHNVNDVILGPGDLSYLQNVFGSRAKVYPKGGHCGNIDHRDNVAYMIQFFQGQTETETSPNLEPPLQPINQPTIWEDDPPYQPINYLHLVSTSSSMTRSERDIRQHLKPEGQGSRSAEEHTSPFQEEVFSFESTEMVMPLGTDTIHNPTLYAQDTGPSNALHPQTNEPRKPISKMVKADARYAIDIYDPWEEFNRTMYNFNARFDDYVFLPAVAGYEAVTPDFVEDRISNFFSNIDDIRNLLNSLLQLKADTTVKTAARFLINSTLGLAGFWDHATGWGLPQQTEDFGQTLGHYGVGNGPYVVLPIFGPSNLRDTSGLIVDKVAQFFYLYKPLDMNDNPEFGIPYSLLNSVDTRHKVSFRYFQTGSPFEYDLIRLLYDRTRTLEIEK